ncbi:MAG: DUF3486 family protein [Muribaculaceae bacterium]|nr:DUF3486 family protein [Muribaculaceae bacterium]
MRRKNRSRSKISQLPAELRSTVDAMILAVAEYRYEDIREYLAQQGVDISRTAIGNYARNLIEEMEAIHVAQENFRALAAEAQKMPELEYTEVINRVAAQRMLQAVVSKPEEAWNDVSLDKLLREINGMTKAVAYKQRIDLQNKGDVAAAVDALKATFFSALGAEHPELYKQLVSVLEKQREGGE